MSEVIKAGDTISVHYVGKLEDGQVFDSSEGEEPLKFTVGQGHVIEGINKAVVGLKAGEKTSVSIPSEEAYGERSIEKIIELPNENLTDDLKPEVGMQVTLTGKKGNQVPAFIVEILEESIKVDLNHPFAGMNLNFDIQVVETGLEPDPHHDHECGDGCNHD